MTTTLRSKGQRTNVKPLDGRVGGSMDPSNQKNSEISDDEDKSREQQLRSQNRRVIVKECKDAISELKDRENDRTSTNDDMNAIRSGLQSKGISKKALAIAIQISKMDEDELDGLWLSLDILSEAIDRPIQKDLFKPKDDKAA